MRHFVAYHNTEKMGRALHEGEPLRLLTNKSVNNLRDNAVWFITGSAGTGERQFALGSVFRVEEIGEGEQGFKHSAKGPGHVFDPPVSLNDAAWFPELKRAAGNFGLGVQETTDARVIQALTELAAGAGYRIE